MMQPEKVAKEIQDTKLMILTELKDLIKDSENECTPDRANILNAACVTLERLNTIQV